VERFVPQAAVTPRVAAVVSHGGSGTVLATLAAGVPQICVPYSADQPINARAVSGAGAGITLAEADLNGETVTVAVTRILSEPAIRASAAAIAQEIARMPSPAEVAATLVSLVSA